MNGRGYHDPGDDDLRSSERKFWLRFLAVVLPLLFSLWYFSPPAPPPNPNCSKPECAGCYALPPPA